MECSYVGNTDVKGDLYQYPSQADSPENSCGVASKTPPIQENAQNGESVGNMSLQTRAGATSSTSDASSCGKGDETTRWYAARVTYGRAQSVYQAIVQLGDSGVTPYIPLARRPVCRIVNGKATVTMAERPVHTGLLFVNASLANYRKLLNGAPQIPGLTPFYDHFTVSSAGRNEYLVVPDRQFDSFRRILESGHDDILINQEKVPAYLVGKHVRVISGPFAGVEGTLLKWKHQRRVFVSLGSLGTFGTGYISSGDVEVLE